MERLILDTTILVSAERRRARLDRAIAATAIGSDRTVVTGDVRRFAGLPGVQVRAL